ncbi:MAG: sigma 54-interacting transcriptional regulator [Deltaproteobacteria bacterium]|nr:sigma 54-interacting transcriptional regulator [Deltaproteobacteria bacterium]
MNNQMNTLLCTFPDALSDIHSQVVDLFHSGNHQKGFGYYIYYYLNSEIQNSSEHIEKSLQILCRSLMDSGYFTELAFFLERYCIFTTKSGNAYSKITYRLFEAEKDILTNYLSESEKKLEEIALELNNNYYRELEATLMLLNSSFYRLTGYLEQSITSSHKILEIISEVNDPLLPAKAYLSLARTYRERQLPNDALKYYNLAIQSVGHTGNQYFLGNLYLESGNFIGTELEKAKSSLQLKSIKPGAWYLGKALKIFTCCGTHKDLEKVYKGLKNYGRRASDKHNQLVINEKSHHLSFIQVRSANQIMRLALNQIKIWEKTIKYDQSELLESIKIFIEYFVNEIKSLVESTVSLNDLTAASNSTGNERDRLLQLSIAEQLLSTENSPELYFKTLTENICTLLRADGAVFSPSSDISFIKSTVTSGIIRGGWENKIQSHNILRMEGTLKLMSETGMRNENTQHPSHISFPVKSGEIEYGMLYCEKYTSGGVFNLMDYQILKSLGGNAARSIENFSLRTGLENYTSNINNIFESANFPVLCVNENLEIEYFNKSSKSFLGLKILKGLQLVEIFPEVEFKKIVASGKKMLVDIRDKKVYLSIRPFYFPNNNSGYLVIINALSVIPMENEFSIPSKYSFDSMAGSSLLFTQRREFASRISQTSSDILITGESGTGKEVFAQSIHNAGRNSEEPFIAINCAAIPSSLLESELFGYVEGAFTGAKKGGQPGKFQLTARGTLLLDEIGDMPMEMQVKLLRVLQERKFRPVGGLRENIFSGRIISTTNRNLEHLVKENRFRQDLLYRLKVMHIELPPLRERKSDIEEYISFFINSFNKKNRTQISGFTGNLLKILKQYHWPGNIRELKHLVESECLLLGENEKFISTFRTGFDNSIEPLNFIYEKKSSSMEVIEKEVLKETLRKTNGKLSHTARKLGLSRATVYNKIKKYNISVDDYRNTESL